MKSVLLFVCALLVSASVACSGQSETLAAYESAMLPLGSNVTVTANNSGELWLGMNDDAFSGNWDDNYGSIQATVTVMGQVQAALTVGQSGLWTSPRNWWVDTGISLTTGTTIQVTASGTWYWNYHDPNGICGPDGDLARGYTSCFDGFCPGALWGQLIGYVGTVPPLPGACASAGSDGRSEML